MKARWVLGALMMTLVPETPARAENPSAALYTMNTDGSQAQILVRIPGQAEHASPRWSHDGKRVAFDTLPFGGGIRTLWVVNADGTGRRQIGAGSMPAWSPDDKQFACHYWPGRGRAQLFALNVDGEGRSLLSETYGNSPRWSPDGSKLVTSDLKNLSVTDLVSGESGQLLDQPMFEVFKGFDWSPDGKRLSAVRRPSAGALPQLVIVDAAGAGKGFAVRLSADLGGFVSFSPDGKRLAYSAADMIHIVDVDGNGPPRLVPGQLGKNRHPDWSPDGKRFVFVSERDAQ